MVNITASYVMTQRLFPYYALMLHVHHSYLIKCKKPQKLKIYALLLGTQNDFVMLKHLFLQWTLVLLKGVSCLQILFRVLSLNSVET